jgi:SAM-dependent methyltransferase
MRHGEQAGRDAARRVRDALDRAGYEEPQVLELLGVAALPSFRRRQPLSPGLREGGPLETLVRLFLLKEPVPLEAARRAIAPARVEDGIEAGLLEADPLGLCAAVELTPYEGLVVAADWPGGRAADPLEVMGVAASTRALAQMTVRRRAARTLDLGTGSGVLALLAAAHSDSVLATDRNPRALDFARFNAEFNAVANLTFLAGDLFEPLRGETFDLIVCNPPFVIAPGVEYVHTHSGRPADTLCREIVRAAPARLAEGGLCQLVCNWARVAGQDWQERLAGWLEGTGCDAWVIHSHSEDAAAYACARIAETTDDPALSAGRFDEWMAYYGRERIEAVGFGLITLRRRTSSGHTFRWDRLADVAGPIGPAIERAFGPPALA